MKLEILLSCVGQTDNSVVCGVKIYTDAVVINQCDKEAYEEYPTERGVARVYSMCERGLTRSRNAAIERSTGDVCLLCDDDEVFVSDYEKKITDAYEMLPEADVIILKMCNRTPSFSDKVMRLRFPKTLKVSSWQISFRRESIVRSGVRFDELLGAGSGNGAEEELDFLMRCERAGLQIWYVPVEIASVAQEKSTWFCGFNEKFFYDRGATTRYILGFCVSAVYALYYVVKKRLLYRDNLSFKAALCAIFRGICDDKIGKQAREKKESRSL